MKIIADTKALTAALALAARAVASRSPKQVLLCCHMEATADEGLKIRTTDTEAWLSLATQKVEVDKPGAVVVDVQKVLQIAKTADAPTLKLEAEQDVLRITGKGSRFKVFGHPPSDFPDPPKFKGDVYTIATADLSRVLDHTTMATAKENSRYAINGVLFDRKQKVLTVVATDGHRLALDKADCVPQEGAKVVRSAIVPAKAVGILLTLSDYGDDITVTTGDGWSSFQVGPVLLSTTLVEGNFPPYEDVIPKNGDKIATFDAHIMSSACRRGGLLANEDSKGVRMSFDGNALTISSRAPELGEASIDVGLVKYEGDGLEIGFNPRYLLDAIKPLSGEVTIELKSSNKPGVVRQGRGVHVVMPVNLQ